MRPVPTSLKWLLAGLAGFAGAGVLAGAAALYVIFSGAFDASASTPHRAIVAWATHTTMIHSVRARAADITAPRAFSAAEVQAGLASYDQHCVACHGGPGIPRAPFVSAMTPTAPYLLDAARRWSPAELYYIVHRGVKMTAMPAWGEVLSDKETWNLVAFLEALPKMSAADYARLRQAQLAAASPARPDR